MNKPHIIFIPGLLCDEVLWHAQLQNFSAGYNCYVADISKYNNIEQMADAILKVAPEKFILIGFSLGVWVALCIAQKVPEKVAGIALISAVAGTLKLQTRESFLQTIDAIKAGSFQQFTKSLFKQYVAEENYLNHKLQETMETMMFRVGSDVALNQIQAMLNFQGPFADLENIKCPALVVKGKFDIRVDAKEQQHMANQLANAKVVIIKHAAHFIPLENPEELNSLLQKWLSDNNL